MIDLESYNSRSPYKATKSSDDGFYEFVTDYGVHYSIGFMFDDTIINHETYQFIIANVNNKISPNDDKVRIAVMVMIDEFFKKNNKTMLYICETGDGKQAMRNRLFQYWFSKYERKAEFTYLSSSIIDLEGVVNYATLIIRNDNPNLVEVITQFTETIQLLSNKPD